MATVYREITIRFACFFFSVRWTTGVTLLVGAGTLGAVVTTDAAAESGCGAFTILGATDSDGSEDTEKEVRALGLYCSLVTTALPARSAPSATPPKTSETLRFTTFPSTHVVQQGNAVRLYHGSCYGLVTCCTFTLSAQRNVRLLGRKTDGCGTRKRTQADRDTTSNTTEKTLHSPPTKGI